jgi:hypothetical protein
VVVALGVAATILTLPAAAAASEAVPRQYVVDFLATSGEVVDINEAGQVIGERNIDEGCDPFCVIVPSEAGVWDERGFTPLPMQPDWSWVILEGISADGWIVGTAYLFDDIRGIVWKPNGPDYDIIEIGNLPDTDFSTVTGIDDHNRVIGFNDRQFPLEFKPFVWTEAGGLVDLTDLGFPSYAPEAISPAGTVAYLFGWYELDVPGVVHENTATPDGFAGPGPYMAINDAGDQVRLVTDGHEPIFFPMRYTNTGEWQYLGGAGGETSTYAGGITSNLDVTVTLSNSGWVAEGPTMEGENLGDRLAPSYGDATGYDAGPLAENGQMAARLNIGKAPRVVRLVPAERCLSNCIRVRITRFRSEFVDDPSDPGRCVGTAHTRSSAQVRVTDQSGSPLAGVEITGRFLTEYRHDGVVTGTTDASGTLRLGYRSAPCTGAMTFLVSGAQLDGWTFDRRVGKLQEWLIPALEPAVE